MENLTRALTTVFVLIFLKEFASGKRVEAQKPVKEVFIIESVHVQEYNDATLPTLQWNSIFKQTESNDPKGPENIQSAL